LIGLTGTQQRDRLPAPHFQSLRTARWSHAPSHSRCPNGYPFFSERSITARFPAIAGAERIQQVAQNLDYFSEIWCAHEYWELMGAQFKHLSPGARAAVLDWVEAGPQGRQLERLKTDFEGKPIGDELLARRAMRWRVAHLQAYKEDLPPEWKTRYDAWAATVGEEEHLGFATWIGEVQSVGNASPLNKSEIAEKNLEEVVAFLKSWTPTGDFFGPRREGLASVLEQQIKEGPQRYAASALIFAEVPSAYVAIVLRSLAEAFRKGAIADIEPTLDLANAIVAEHPASADEEKDEWSYTRLEAARLAENILTIDPPVASGLREKIWALIQALTSDSSPSADDEDRQGSSGMEPFSLSLNRTRGMAIHALFRYCAWVKRLNPAGEFDLKVAASEAVNVMHERLDPAKEKTRTIRSVFGQFFPVLNDLDYKLASDLKASIFPVAEADAKFWHVAWNSYVVAWQPEIASI
ncbi:MAG TPA: hypothetical protein VFC29_13800, partial [Candidatus Limnocylindrales bacterium]|nr:hypothetical protein [Candidatus Limnocylindrales bacterium]